MASETQTLAEQTLKLAERHGLTLRPDMSFNEQGLDFRIGFAQDQQGTDWVLRIPRRSDVLEKMKYESKVLSFVKSRLSVPVPNWIICSDELVAYPRLGDKTALEFDPVTYAVTWHIDQHSPLYRESLARALVELHGSPLALAKDAGLRIIDPTDVRKNFHDDLMKVKAGIGLSAQLERHCLEWLDRDDHWPDFSVLVHGDLYAGHITADKDSRVSGIIDWTEAEASDPSIDFAGHLAAFDRDSLKRLIASYEDAGGRTWPKLLEQTIARHAASPIRYGVFALISGKAEHIEAAKAVLHKPIT